MKKITWAAVAALLVVGAQADMSAWQTQAQGTTGNIVADTAGYTFDGTAGISYDYGALDELGGKAVDGSTIEYIYNLTDAATSSALGSILGWSPGNEQTVFKVEQWNDTGKFGMTIPGYVDYTLGTDSVWSGVVKPVQVVFRRNNDGGTVDLFVNGAHVETHADKTNWRQDGGVGTLGSTGDLGTDVLTGAIYGVGTYDVALTNQEIADLYAAIPEPATLGMVAAFGGGILFIRRKLML